MSPIYSGLSVQHPASWRFVPIEMVGAGPSGPVAYLTDQHTTPQCVTTSSAAEITSTCGPPVKVLRPDGVFITFTGYFQVLHPPTSHNRVLDGHLATVQATTIDASNCPSGATGVTQMTVFIPNPAGATPVDSGQTVTMSACYAGPDSTAITQKINTLIDSVTFD